MGRGSAQERRSDWQGRCGPSVTKKWRGTCGRAFGLLQMPPNRHAETVLVWTGQQLLLSARYSAALCRPTTPPPIFTRLHSQAGSRLAHVALGVAHRPHLHTPRENRAEKRR